MAKRRTPTDWEEVERLLDHARGCAQYLYVSRPWDRPAGIEHMDAEQLRALVNKHRGHAMARIVARTLEQAAAAAAG